MSLVAGLLSSIALVASAPVNATANNPATQTTPLQVPGLTGVFTAVASRGSTAYALRNDGALYAWGANGNGQVGNGTTTTPTTPALVFGASTTNPVIGVASGNLHAYALRADGIIRAWGRNLNGQLGNGSTVSYATGPVVVTGISNATKITAGGYHGLALLADGTVKAWGGGFQGQLGISNTASYNTPQTVSFGTPAPKIATVDASSFGSAAITHSGELYTWGNNAYGELGQEAANGTTVTTPTLVPNAFAAAPTTFAYAADGLRTSKTKAGVTTSFVWARTDAVAPLLAEKTGNAWTYYLYGPSGTPYAQVDSNGAVTYLHADRLGSVRLATTGNGTTVGAATWDPYGNTTATVGVMPNLGWAGEYRDRETGLTYLRARYYDPATAQFLTRDPLEATTRDPYGYAAGDPINNTDPSGLCPWCLVGVALVEIGLSAWDAYDAYTTITDNCASGEKKAMAGGLFLLGIILPGGGSGALDNLPDAARLVRGGAGPVRVGQQGLDALKITQNTTRISLGGGRYRVPDLLDEASGVIGEVKNVKRLSYTAQLRDYVAYAQANGLQFDLYVRRSTELSGPLQRAVDDGLINLKPVL